MSDTFTFDIVLRDPQAIEIVQQLPEATRNEIIEKYIVLGNMVVSHASIATSRESVEAFFAPLKADIDTIREQLRLVVPAVKAPRSKGSLNEKVVFESLQEHFMDDAFEDVSALGKYADIKATTNGQEVLIEVKAYSRTVPGAEVEKFWRDLERRNIRYGLFISMHTPITKMSGPIKIETQLGRTGIFVDESRLSSLGHIFGFYVIKKIIDLELQPVIKDSQSELKRCVAKISQYLSELQADVQIIEDLEGKIDRLQSYTRSHLEDMMQDAHRYRQRITEKLKDALEEIERSG